MGRFVVRAGMAIAVGLLATLLVAAPASAHTISGPRPTNFRTRITSVTPDVPGVHVRVVDLGSRLELTNDTDVDVIVRAPEGEPYLRIGPDGVFENLLSPATYLNRTRSRDTAVPPEAANARPGDPPKWHKISSGHTSRWHDHRAHWMGGQPPPAVRAAPDKFFRVGEWHLSLDHGTTRIAVVGTLDWVPGPSGIVWLPLLVALFAIGVLAGLWKRGLRALAALVALLVVVDIAHAVTYQMGRPGGFGSRAAQFAGGNFVSIIVWCAAIAVIVGLVRRRTEALYGAIVVAVMVALVGGATDLSALWKSQLVNVGPDWLTRLEIVVALALGLGVAAGALVRALRSERVARDAPTTKWLSLLVEGLDDAELARVAADLDVDEVLAVALRDVANRARPDEAAFAAGSLVFVVDDATWSIATDGADAGLHAQRRRVEPVAAELQLSFPVLLQVLAGTRPVDRTAVIGDLAFFDRVARALPETSSAISAPPDRASAS
jgi:hypothetical protein